MSTPSKAVAWSKNLSDEDSKIGRALAGGHLPFLAKAVVGHECLYELVFLHILDRIDAECNTLCQRNAVPPSVFWKIPVSQLGVFDWKSCMDELLSKAPSLLQILTKITSHSDHCNKNMNSAHFPSICMAAAVILKERNKNMCGVQSLLSLLLFASRRHTQAFQYLNEVVLALNWLYAS